MPPPVRRKTLVLVLAFGAALAVTTVAYAGNGGFAPLTPHSPNARRINDAYVWISIFSGAIFVLVEGTLLWFVFYKLPGIQDVPAAKAEGGPVRIQVNAHQFYWQFTYPDGSISIDELHAPVNRTVRVDITSQDVDHSWWVPELGGKFDAIPGHTTHTWFKADHVGTYRGRCGEFCGVFHAAMKAVVDVQTQAEYTAWLGSAAGDLGRSEWAGACAKCHGLQGEGDYGPKISNNALLTQAQGLEQLIRNGKNKMPPVARGWSEEQVRALVAYLKQKVYKGTSSGG